MNEHAPHVGFTGTRNGMTDAQKEVVQGWLREYARDNAVFHHGDCIGADEQGARIANKLGMYIVCHPPIDDTLRAYTRAHETREPLTHFARNRAIVDECVHLIATPYLMGEQVRGGTWYTIRYAQKIERPVTIIWSNGTVERR